MRVGQRAFIGFSLALISMTSSKGEERYPFRLPDWLWADDERYKDLIGDDERREIFSVLKEASEARKADNQTLADKKEDEARRLIHSQIARRDLVRSAPLLRAGGFAIALHLDPEFSSEMQPVLTKAAEIFVNLAVRREVVETALAESSDRPEPWPERMVEGKVNPLYRNRLQSIVKPESADGFIAEMTSVMKLTPPELPLLIISSYSGNVWWGGGIYDAYRASEFHLKRLGSQGFLYIRLNRDRMTQDSLRQKDPAFWASKIAHEILHNLGYWHPNYADPAERDRLSRGSKPFIVAYEERILKAAEESR